MKKLVFLIFLGVVSTFIPAVSLFYLVFLFVQWFQKNNTLFSIGAFLGIIEICGLEFWGRLTNMDPFFPYEISKYLVFFYLVGFIFMNNLDYKTFPITLFIVCLIYSVWVIADGQKFGRVIGDANGLLIMLMASMIFQKSRFQISELQIKRLIFKWIDYLLLGLVFVVLKTPNIEDINFKLGANYEATGGESANQVSTYLGLGTALLGYLIISKRSYSGNVLVDRILLFAFFFQSLLTFSRGGIIVGMVVMGYWVIVSGYVKLNNRNILVIFSLILLLIIGFQYLDGKSKGMLSNRFNGETEATLAGKKDKNLNVMTSNRLQIIEENWEIFKNNVFGVGPSLGTEKRKEIYGSSFYDHTEPSRWLVEYGIFGIILFTWFNSVLFKYVKFSFPDNASRPYSAFLVAMILFSSLTMLHSATRTFVSFLPMVVGFIKLNPNVATANRRNKSQ